MDWNVIKKEYIAGGTSYRKLAKKYNVSESTLTRTAIKEHWSKLKKQSDSKTEAKIIENVSKDKSKTVSKIISVADKLIAKMDASIDKIDVIDGHTIKSYTSALKDLKDITGLKSEIDLKEQEARIAKLQKDAELNNDNDGKEIGIVLIPSVLEPLKPPEEDADE